MARIGFNARTVAVVYALVVGVCATGCRERAGPERRERERFLAFVGIGQNDALWHVLRASARRAYERLGVSPPPLRTAAPRVSSVNAQKKLLDALWREGMGALCVQVTEPDALAGTLESLAHRGVCIATMVRPISASVAFFHAGYDEQAIGAALADAMAEAIGRAGTVAILHADSVDPVSAARRAAFKARIARFPDIHVILEFDCRAQPGLAVRLITDTMQRFPRLSGWAVMDNWPLRRGTGPRVTLPAGCRVVAVDPFPATWASLASGQTAAMVASAYDELAGRALTACVAELGGTGRTPAPFAAPVRVIRGDELEGFKRDWERWTSEDDARDK